MDLRLAGRGEATGEDKAFLDEAVAGTGAVIAGRSTYEAAGHWGDTNPWGVPFFIVTHRPEEQPPGDDFTFVGRVPEAIERAKAAAGEKNVHVMGGADIIRQALAGRYVDGLTIIMLRSCSAVGSASSKGSHGHSTSSTSVFCSHRSPRSSITA